MNVLSGDEKSNVKLSTQNQLLIEYPYTHAGIEEVYQIPIYGMTRDNFDMRFIPNDIYLFIYRWQEDIFLLDMGDRQMWGQRRQG